MRSVKAQGPIASDNLNPLRGFNVATIVYFLKIEKEKCFYLVLYLVDDTFFDEILEFGVQGYSSHDDK